MSVSWSWNVEGVSSLGQPTGKATSRQNPLHSFPGYLYLIYPGPNIKA